MKFSPSVLPQSSLLLILLLITTVSALRCYRCWYEEGSANSIDDCESDPKEQHLINVPPYPVWSRHPSVLGSYAANFTGIFTVGDEANYNNNNNNNNNYNRQLNNFGLPVWYTYCMKVSGKSYGRNVIIRDAAWSKSPDGAGLCEERLPGNINIPGLTEVQTCYCNQPDGCNGAGSLALSFGVAAMAALLGYIHNL